MFTQDRSATASYRTLARGSGGRWARTYRILREDHAARRTAQRRNLGESLIGSHSRSTGEGIEPRGGRRRS